MPIVTEEKIRVRYGETDQMGHAYYGNYLLWFEQSRGAWCRVRGFSYQEMEELGYYMPVIEAHIKYRSELLYDQVMVVRVHLAEVGRLKLRFEYEIVNESTGKVCTTGYTVHVLMNRDRKAVPVPAQLREWMERTPTDAVSA